MIIEVININNNSQRNINNNNNFNLSKDNVNLSCSKYNNINNSSINSWSYVGLEEINVNSHNNKI